MYFCFESERQQEKLRKHGIWGMERGLGFLAKLLTLRKHVGQVCCDGLALEHVWFRCQGYYAWIGFSMWLIGRAPQRKRIASSPWSVCASMHYLAWTLAYTGL
eukprot:4003794-Amphidinium_carterae.1